ncbi:MAG: winged helix-turn-helix domain-containing protein [Cyanobacteria bacterium J06592_8]
MDELATFIASNPDPRELKRALAVSMTLKGHTHKNIMKVLQVSSGFISKWKQAFIMKGIAGLKLGYQGSKSYLKLEQKQQVLDWLKRKNYWNLNELECYIAQEFNVVFEGRTSYYNLFHEAGLSWKKSQKENPSKDLKLVAQKKRKLKNG